MKKPIAFFDFDGTITTRDTLLEFIKYSKGVSNFYLGFLRYAPYLLAFKLKLISNQTAKEKILGHFFAQMPLDKFEEQCSRFTETVLPQLIREKAVAEIRQLQENGVLVVIVSASPENWIRTWATSMNVQLIASRLEVVDNRLTGKLIGKNCHGDEKVSRIRSVFHLEDYKIVAAYGDSSGDTAMLRLAETPHFKPFRG